MISGKFRTILFAGTAVLLFLSLLGCGLPNAASLPKPTIVTSTSSVDVLAFQTPNDTTDIIGYTVYYKVYFSQTDFDSEQDEAVWFYEGSYINSNDEMQPGPVIPNERGYIRVGVKDASMDFYQSYQILNPGNSTPVYIDFNSAIAPEPIVGLVDPITVPAEIVITLLRGVIDPTAISKDMRSFVGDWDFDDGSPADNFYDADLRRKYPLQDASSVSVLTNFLITGNPFNGATPAPSELFIGVVVHSYGLDPSNLQFIFSKPEYIGVIRYSAITDTNRTDTSR